MLQLIKPEEIEKNWDKYKANIKKAFEATDGGALIMSDSNKDFYKYTYDRLVNPFQNSMTLWVEGEENYVVLTQLQKCSFTGKKTLVLNACTRVKDVEKETVKIHHINDEMIGNVGFMSAKKLYDMNKKSKFQVEKL